MKDYWKTRYDRSADRFADSPLKQVERTINGIEMGPGQLTLTIAAVCDALDLRWTDCVADLCCGNGLVTRVVADITALEPAFLEGIGKVCIRDPVSRLDSSSLLRLLRILSDSPSVDAIFIAGKLAVYYDDERKMEYHRQQETAETPHSGSWWSRAQIQEIVAAAGFRVRLIDQHPRLVSAYYRYDCLIQSSDATSTDQRRPA